jgi:hypothetical protein
MTDLMPLVREFEARLAADVKQIGRPSPPTPMSLH